MRSKDIKEALLSGKGFGNESANWYSLVNIEKKRFMIMINDELKFYKNLDSVSKRIFQLTNRGY